MSLLINAKPKLSVAYDLSFEEERTLNNPIYSFEAPLEVYRKSFDEKKGHGLYEWEDLEFVDTALVSKAANYFKANKDYEGNQLEKGSLAWKLWWDREEYRRKHGISLPIKSAKGGGLSDKDRQLLWIPGELYGMLNYGPIIRTVDPEDAKLKKQMAAAASGDTDAETKRKSLDDLFAGLTNKIVTESDYDFPDFWDGHFHSFVAIKVAEKLGLDVGFFKSRRKGFSYIAAWLAMNQMDLFPRTVTCLVAYDNDYLIAGPDALMNMVYRYSDFINLHTDWKKQRLVDNTSELKLGFKYKGNAEEHGFLSSILALSARDNPSCVRGKNARKVFYEECGTFPNLLDTIEATSSTNESGAYTVGQSLYWGTVGSKDAEYKSLAHLFYNPYGSNILPFNNIFDVGKRGRPCMSFFSHFQNMDGAMDKEGNSNIAYAKELFAEHDRIKKQTALQKDYEKWRAERATVPMDALSTKTTNIFSHFKQDLLHQIEFVDNSALVKKIERHGTLKRDRSGRVLFVDNSELTDSHPSLYDSSTFLSKDYDMHGCVVEWDEPYLTFINGVLAVPDKLYYAWHDPYATDKNTKDIKITDSVGATYIYECANGYTSSKGDRVVATWHGRPSTVDEYNRILFLLLERWNAKMLFENDRGEVIPYAKRYKLTRFLIEEPSLLSMKELSAKGGRTWGISIGQNMKRKGHGALLLRDQLGEPIGQSGITGETRPWLTTFYCRRGLRELIEWDPVNNYDCVSALIVGMFQTRELLEADIALTPTGNFDYANFFDRRLF